MSGLENARVLVTGANGFIGSHLVDRLLKEKADVSVLVRSRGSEKKRFDNVKVYEGDITDYRFVEDTVDKVLPEKVFHLAANLNKSFDEILNVMKVNLNGALNLLKSLNDRTYNSFIYVSIGEFYGNNKVPFKEDMELHPLSPYSLSKIAAELVCRYFYENHKSPITILRGFIVYGPRQKGDMFIPSIISNLIQKGEFDMTQGYQTRDFVYIDDFIESVIKASITKQAIGETINICSGEEHSIKEVSNLIVGILGKGKLTHNRPYRENEQWRYFGDNSKAKSILNWCPTVGLNEGLKKTIESYKG